MRASLKHRDRRRYYANSGRQKRISLAKIKKFRTFSTLKVIQNVIAKSPSSCWIRRTTNFITRLRMDLHRHLQNYFNLNFIKFIVRKMKRREIEIEVFFNSNVFTCKWFSRGDSKVFNVWEKLLIEIWKLALIKSWKRNYISSNFPFIFYRFGSWAGEQISRKEDEGK